MMRESKYDLSVRFIVYKEMCMKFVVFACFLSCLSSLFASPRTLSAPEMNPPQIDGIVDEGEWQNASVDTHFIQIQPQSGEPVSESTQVLIGMDPHHLYVAFKCYYKDPSIMTAGIVERDQVTLNDDAVAIVVDTFFDKRSAYVFLINMLNTQTDIRVESNGSNEDRSWDTAWQSATTRDQKGWYAEIAIPFKQIKFYSGKIWGVNFVRSVARNNEAAWWSGLLDTHLRISQYGELHLAFSPKVRKPIEIMPYISQRYDDYLEREKVQDWSMEMGLDAEIPLNSELSLNATINPDFASVEGDEEELNLDLWEINYPEKRPFFRDVNALFDTRIDLFYSRRIGDIQHGEKIAGKLGPFQIAGIYARTRSVDYNGDSFPEANYSAVRLQKDILSASTLGITAVDKSWHGGYHRSIGIDTKMRLPRQFYVTGQFVASWPGDFWDHAGGFIRVARENNDYHYHLRYTSYGKDFMDNLNATGLIYYDDVKELDGDIEYNLWLNNKTFRVIEFASKNRIDWHQNHDLWRYKFSQNIEVFLTNRLSIDSEILTEYRERDEGNPDFRSYSLDLGYNTQEWSNIELGYEWGDSFTQPFRLIGVDTQFKLFKKLSVKYEFSHLVYDPDPDDENTQIHILSTDFYLTPNLFLQVFSQYRSNNERAYFYGKFGYRYNPPNSAIYITFTHDEEEYRLHPTAEPTSRILFLKLSHAFSI